MQQATDIPNNFTKPIPDPGQFGISVKTGFLPESPPLKRMVNPYFEPWESVLDDLSHLLVAWKLRTAIEKMPELDTSVIQREDELQRAFLVLCLLSHAYVWGAKGEPVLNILPRNLSVPWLKVSHRLGLRPISCHAGLVYYNFKLLDTSDDSNLSLNNLGTLHTVSGGIDESWFYLVTVAIESAGKDAPHLIYKALNACLSDDLETISGCLNKLATAVNDMTAVLLRMYENCDPYIFYNRVRIYFSGWSNMKTSPEGLFYEGEDFCIEKLFFEEEGTTFIIPESKGKKYAGGSAAQSALIHTLDVFFGIKHFPTKQTTEVVGQENKMNFLLDMRYHMPGKFRRWLTELEKAPSISDYIKSMESRSDIPAGKVSEVTEAFNQCILAMKTFRDKHIQIVTRYIVIPARKAQASLGNNGQASGSDLLNAEGYHGTNVVNASNGVRGNETPSEDRGTGGTQVIPFLKQSRDETADALLKK